MRLRSAYIASTLAVVACGSRTPLSEGGQAHEAPESTKDDPAAEPGPAMRQPQCVVDSQSGELSWVTRLGADGRVKVVTDATGNSLLESERGGAANDVIKLDQLGQRVWSVHFEPDVQVSGGVASLATDPTGNTFVVNPFAQNGWRQPMLSKVSPRGDVSFTRPLTRNPDGFWSVSSLATDRIGNATVLGVASTPVDLGGGRLKTSDRDLFIGRFDVAGDHLWSESFGGEIGYADLALERDGTVVVAGSLTGSVTFGGQALSAKVGSPFIARFLPGGSVAFARLFNTSDEAAIRDVAVDSRGNSYLGLTFAGELDLDGTRLESGGPNSTIVMKHDPQGRLLWSKVLGYLYSFGLALSPQDDLVLAGSSAKPVALGGEPAPTAGWQTFVAKLDQQGNPVWIRSSPGASEFAVSVAVDACQGVLVAGAFSGSFDTGAEVVRTPPRTDDTGVSVVASDTLVMRIGL